MSRAKPPTVIPYAVGLFYKPSLAAARAAGVELPSSRVSLRVCIESAAKAGVILPPSHIDLHPDADAPPPPPPPPPPESIHKLLPLPATMFRSTSAIHPNNYDKAEAFVRIQDFDPATMVIPDPAPGRSTPAVLYTAGAIRTGEDLDKLRSFEVRRTSELESVLTRDGPILVQVLELEQLREAPKVFQLLKEKKEQGWDCWPSIKLLSSLACVAVKMEDVQLRLLPRLRSKVRDKKRGSVVRRRLRVIKEHAKKVRYKVQGDVISPGICGEIARSISRVHAKVPQKKPSYLVRQIDQFAPKLLSDLSRPIVFYREE